jgi:C1A family cysteine protease
MKSSFLAASVLICLAAVACKKEAATKKQEGTAKASSSPKEKATPQMAASSDKPAAPKGHRPSRETTVAFGQKPPKPEKMVAPKVPDLPELAKQEHPAAPTKLPSGEYACGASHSGAQDMPLMCLEDKDHHHSEKTASVLVPYGHLKGKLTPLPRVVDHREEQTEGDVRNQGSAGTCTSFGTASAIDHSVTRWSGTSSHVSTMELWGRYHQTDLGDALIATVGQTFADEDAWPYDAKVAWPWRSCGKGSVGKAEGPCGRPVDKAKLAELAKKPQVIVEQVEWLPKDFELIRRKIAGGEDPIFAIKLPRHFKPVGKSGSMYIPDYKDEAGGHALALAGYAVGPKGDNYYLIHNSWGTGWGDSGYAWIHEATLAKHMMNGFGIVDARPIKGERAHREGKVCQKGHAPDSLTGACEAECKDGGPTHNGVCPDEADCPKGFVNLWGACIGAAPTDSGKDVKTDISWKCGPGGCAYTLPKKIGKCEKEPCMLSCPAPSFRAAKDDHGLTCVE